MCKEDPRAVQAKATTHLTGDMGAKITLTVQAMHRHGPRSDRSTLLVWRASYDDIDIVIHRSRLCIP
jgi:hypothetical protein